MEGGPAIDTAKIRSALDRLSDKSRPAQGDHTLYTIEVRSKEKTTEKVKVFLDGGHKRQPEANLDLIAEALHVSRDQLEDLVAGWSKDDYLKHCRKLRPAELRPLSLRRGAPGAMPAGTGRGASRKARKRGRRAPGKRRSGDQ